VREKEKHKKGVYERERLGKGIDASIAMLGRLQEREKAVGEKKEASPANVRKGKSMHRSRLAEENGIYQKEGTKGPVHRRKNFTPVPDAAISGESLRGINMDKRRLPSLRRIPPCRKTN